MCKTSKMIKIGKILICDSQIEFSVSKNVSYEKCIDIIYVLEQLLKGNLYYIICKNNTNISVYWEKRRGKTRTQQGTFTQEANNLGMLVIY